MASSLGLSSVNQPATIYRGLYSKAQSSGLSHADIARFPVLGEISPRNAVYHYIMASFRYLLIMMFLITAGYLMDWPIKNEKFVQLWFKLRGIPAEDIEMERCMLHMPDTFAYLFRPPIDCFFCKNITTVHRVEGIMPEEFETLYAYSGQPVVITDATKNWSALSTFSFEFFQGIYGEDSPVLKNSEASCQFFPYKTDFRNLREVFQMSIDRAQMKDGSVPWYIGWSNCDVAAGNILRQHYQRPYFLPPSAESSKTDWIFMGSPGYGAHMHLDNVHLPSWQAQITGTKRWTLEAPPECFAECVTYMQVDVLPGDIIVLDTNKWYHSTLNVGKDISITIGSEYD